MKIILLVFTIYLFPALSANSAEYNNGFYVVGEAGLGIINKITLDSEQYNRIKNIQPEGYKNKFLKGLPGDIGGIGFGYKINNFRFDLRATHSFTYRNYHSDHTYKNGEKWRYKDIKSPNYHTKDVKMQQKNLDFNINTYYDLPIEFKNITPFVFGGYGISNKKIASIVKSNYLLQDCNYKSKANPFYVLGAGASYNTDPVIFDLTYKYKKNLKDKYNDAAGNSYKIKSHSHWVMIGIRYHF